MKLCPKCGRIAAYNSYFDAYICNYCGWDYRIVRRKIYLKKYHLESDRSNFGASGLIIFFPKTRSGKSEVKCTPCQGQF